MLKPKEEMPLGIEFETPILHYPDMQVMRLFDIHPNALKKTTTLNAYKKRYRAYIVAILKTVIYNNPAIINK